MSKVNEALETYTKAIKKLKNFEKEHEEIFKTQKVLAETISASEKVLKDAVKEYGQDVENKIVRVKYVAKFKKWYEFDILKKVLPAKQVKLLFESEAAVIVPEHVESDLKKIESLIKENQLDGKEVMKAFKEEPMSPAVMIDLVKEK